MLDGVCARASPATDADCKMAPGRANGHHRKENGGLRRACVPRGCAAFGEARRMKSRNALRPLRWPVSGLATSSCGLPACAAVAFEHRARHCMAQAAGRVPLRGQHRLARDSSRNTASCFPFNCALRSNARAPVAGQRYHRRFFKARVSLTLVSAKPRLSRSLVLVRELLFAHSQTGSRERLAISCVWRAPTCAAPATVSDWRYRY